MEALTCVELALVVGTYAERVASTVLSSSIHKTLPGHPGDGGGPDLSGLDLGRDRCANGC